MAIIALPKNSRHIIFPNKKAAEKYVKSLGRDLNTYDFLYIYREMARKRYTAAYYKNHNRLALEYYYRNREKINEQKREKYHEDTQKEA